MTKLKYALVIPFDDKFSTVENTIMASFYPKATETTIKQLQEKSGYSYERVYSGLQMLKKKKVVSEKKVGKTLVYIIDPRTLPAQRAFIHYAITKKSEFAGKYPKVFRAMEELLDKTDIECAVVFGSYARDEVTRESDVDVLCISHDKNLEKNAMSLRHKYNLRVNAVEISKTEFKNIKKDNLDLWQEIIEFGIVLNGYDLFNYLMYR